MTTRSELLDELRKLAAAQGPDITLFKFRAETGISRYLVYDRWGNWTNLRRAAGLPPRAKVAPVYSDAELLGEFHAAAARSGRYPTLHEFDRLSDRAWGTLDRRFGRKGSVVDKYRGWLDQQPADVRPEFLAGIPADCEPSTVPGVPLYRFPDAEQESGLSPPGSAGLFGLGGFGLGAVKPLMVLLAGAFLSGVGAGGLALHRDGCVMHAGAPSIHGSMSAMRFDMPAMPSPAFQGDVPTKCGISISTGVQFPSVRFPINTSIGSGDSRCDSRGGQSPAWVHSRGFSSAPQEADMSKFATPELRNIVLVGHGAAGKTTLADRMLFRAGIGTRAGSVDDGTSQLDIDDEERQRHFSISAKMVHFEHHGVRVNVIDTPGYPDFVGQAISALCAAETAVVVINAASGIEANTRRTFDLARRAHLARMIVINKLDLDNLDVPGLVASIQETFGRNCIPLNIPLGNGTGFHDVVSTLSPATAPADAVLDPLAIGSTVLDAIVEADDRLLERYLEGAELTAEEVLAGARQAVAAGTLIPIFFTCAKLDMGVSELMDAIADFGMAPGELSRSATNEAGAEVAVSAADEAPLVAQVFKTRIDPFVSKMSFIRVFSGRLSKDSMVRDMRTGKGIKIHQLLDVQGGQVEAVDEAHAGDVVVVTKIDDFQVGDTLVNNGSGVALPPIQFPTPMIGLAVEPRSRADQQRISGALHKIEEEDPTFHVERDPQTHEMVMRGMSELHLQIVQNRLHSREKVDIVTHVPKVPYRETILAAAEGAYRHKKQSGGAGQFAEVHLRLTPLPQDLTPAEYFTRERFPGLRDYHYDPELNFAFLDCVSGGSVPNQFIPAVEKGIRERMEQGVIAGYQVQDLAVGLFFGKDHPVDSNENAFRTAASNCFRDVFRQAQPVLLEPIMHLEVTVTADHVGDISSDLSTRRGRMEGMENGSGGLQTVQARAPLSELATYARTLSSLTGGEGAYQMSFSHFEMVPAYEQQKIVASSGMHHAEE